MAKKSAAKKPATSRSSSPPADRALTKYDPLQAYLSEIRRHDLLKPQEEKDLAVQYQEEGDVDAAVEPEERHLARVRVGHGIGLAAAHREGRPRDVDEPAPGRVRCRAHGGSCQ